MVLVFLQLDVLRAEVKSKRLLKTHIPWILVSLPPSSVNLSTRIYPHHSVTTGYVSPGNVVTDTVTMVAVKLEPHLLGFGRGGNRVQDSGLV